MLPAHLLERRHRMIVAVLAAHIPGLLLFGLARGYGLGHVLFDIGPVISLTVIAMLPRVPLRWRMIAACTGLITCSALLVHLWGGVIEAHFHFFVMIGLLTLYQDWVPFLLAIGYVVLHHGVLGVLQPHSVYNNPQAAAHPWRWALIHGAFVLAASLTHVASLAHERAAAPARPAHRPAEPPAADEPRSSSALDRIDRSGRARRRAVPRPRPLQGRQRQPRPRTPATASCSPSPSGCARAVAPPRDAVARFGGDEFVARVRGHRRAETTRSPSPSGCSSALAQPFAFQDGDASRRRQHRHRARDRPGRRAPTTSSATPTPRCTAPSRPAAAAGRCSTRSSAHRAVARQAIEARPAPARSRTTSSSSTTSRSSPSRPAGSSASRRSCAGTTPSARHGRRPPSSSRSPRRPA